MCQKISDETFQRGYQLYQNNQVSPIKQNNNLYAANVRDKQYYRVVIMINDKRKMTKMNCTCPKARKGETCEHETAVYLKLKSEYHVFASDEDTSFLGYYKKQEYDKAIEALKQRTQQLIEQCRYDNMKQTLNGLTGLMNDYAGMTLTPPYTSQIEEIFITAFRKFLSKKKAKAYYLPWVEEIMKNQSLSNMIPLICQFNNYLPSEDVIPLYLNYIEYNMNENLNSEIMTYFIHHMSELSSNEWQILLKHLSVNTQEYQYVMLYQNLDNNNIKEVKRLYEQLKNIYDLKDIEVAIYKYEGDIHSFQQYVLDHYQQATDFNDLSLLKELKEMYGKNWQTAQFEIVDALKDKVNEKTYKDLIKELECYEYQAYCYMDSPSRIIPYELAHYMKDNNNQVYLMMLEQKYRKLIKGADKYSYSWIKNDIENELRGHVTTLQFQEFVYDLMMYFSNEDLNKELMLLLGE